MKKYFNENKKIIIGSLISIVLLILVLSIILIVNVNKESKIDTFKNTLLATIEQAKKLKVDEYELVTFPDTKEIISKDKKIKLSTGKKYNELNKGYIIIYDDGSYAFKLSNGLYCASKTFADIDINIDISGECEDYEVEYK